MNVTIKHMTAEDWPQVREIYQDGIDSENATFESSVPTWPQWDEDHLKQCRLLAVVEGSGEVSGWAALSAVSGRCVYAGVAEVSIYVSARYWGQGIGRLLLERLIEESEEAGIWTLQAGIFPENKASIRLHQTCGFREVGRHKKLGQMTYGKMRGRWRDVILFERRSRVVGID